MSVWKIGSRPGPKENWFKGLSANEASKRYIDLALKRGFVALGYGWIEDLNGLSRDEIRHFLMKRELGVIERRVKEIYSFANELNKGDIILLYKNYQAYLGITTRRYYYVKEGSRNDFFGHECRIDRAPHRINIIWLFNKTPFSIDFSRWQDTLHKVSQTDLGKISDPFLRKFIELNIDNKT